MLEGEILLDDAKLRSVAPSQAQHLGEIVEGDGALERRARQQRSIPSRSWRRAGAIPAARLDPGWHAGAYSLRTESPCSLMRWAPCTMRSQIASAMVGSPITSCQDDTGSLRDHQRRGSTVAIFEDLQQCQPHQCVQRLRRKVVDDHPCLLFVFSSSRT